MNDAYFSNAQQYVDRLKSFGLGDTLGLDIAGEPFPVLKNLCECSAMVLSARSRSSF